MAEKNARDVSRPNNEDLDRDYSVQQGKDPKDLGPEADPEDDPDDEDDEDDELAEE